MPEASLKFSSYTPSAAVHIGPVNKKEEKIVQRPNLVADREDRGKLTNLKKV